MTRRGAAFLDRDGTLIGDAHFLADPARVFLLPDAASAVRRLNEAGWPVIVVTNQSGIARGLFTLSDYERVRERVEELLRDGGARIDDTYVCPHHPDFTGPCECRKPGTLLFRRAAAEHDIDLKKSFYVGDALRDVLPARDLGGRGILVPNAETPPPAVEQARSEFEVAASLDEAATRIIESAG